MKDERAVESLIEALNDEDVGVRSGAAEALGEIGDVRAVEPLIRALDDFILDVQWEASDALGKIGNPAVEHLVDALKDESRNVRRTAAYTLGEIGDTKAVDPLTQTLEDEDVRKAAKEALEKVKTKKS